MTDEHRPTDEDGDGTATPWWVSPPREVWDARPAEPTESPEPAQPAEPVQPGADDTATERYGAVYDVWAPTDTLGREPRPAGGNRTGLLVALAVAIALVAGLAGGALGVLLSDRDGSVTVDGASLGAAPARTCRAPTAASPVSPPGCCRAWCRSRSTPRRARPPAPGS